MSKLPSEIRFQIARNSKDSVWKIDELLHVIKIKVEVTEASEMTKTSKDQVNKTFVINPQLSILWSHTIAMAAKTKLMCLLLKHALFFLV